MLSSKGSDNLQGYQCSIMIIDGFSVLRVGMGRRTKSFSSVIFSFLIGILA